MASKLKKIGIVVGIILILLLAIGFFANPFLESKIESTLQKAIDEDYNLKYNKVSANVWLSQASVSEVQLRKGSSSVEIDAIHLKGVSWLDYLKTKRLNFKTLEIIQPNFKYVDKTIFFKPKSQSDSLEPEQPNIIIKEVNIENGQFTRVDSTVKTNKLHFKNVNLQLSDFIFDSTTSRAKIPFKYSSVDLTIDSINTLVGEFESLHSKNFVLNDKSVSLENIVFRTKYPLQEYHQLLRKERDHYDVYVESIKLENWKYAFKNDSLMFTVSHLSLERPNAFIYRDKLLRDDNSTKKLYGEALRSLPFYLGIKKLSIKNAELKYKEKVIPDHRPGELNFSKINADVMDLGNLNKNNSTSIKIQGQFMNSADLNIDWQFWVNDLNDKFTFKGSLVQLPAEKINSFTKPNLNVGFTGNIKQTYFNIFGSKYSSEIDMQMEYDNFKIELLRKDGSKKNLIKSAIANIFIPKNSQDKDDKFKKVKVNAKPDRSKSFFNYIWINIKNALLKTFGVSK